MARAVPLAVEQLAEVLSLGVPAGRESGACIRLPESVGTPGRACAQYGYTWEHCPHGQDPGDCWRGAAAGAGRLPGGDRVFATRAAAEAHTSTSGSGNASGKKPSPSSSSCAARWLMPTPTGAERTRSSSLPERHMSERYGRHHDRPRRIQLRHTKG